LTGRYAKDTEVSSDKSRMEIERTLARYGADQFLYGWEADRAVIGFRMQGRQIRFILPLPSRDDPSFTTYKRDYATVRRVDSEAQRRYEQAVRQKWRALALVIKAKLEAVESNITEFDNEFLAHIVLANGQTFGDWAKPQIEQMYLNGGMPPLLIAGPRE
jgi:hypothetical protein